MGIDTIEGKTAFITGGASGIGLGIARALVGRGAKAVLADMRSDHIDTALSGFAGGQRSNQVSAIEIDVTDRAAFARAAEQVQEEHGGLDILINNAGVGIEGPIIQAGYVDWDFGLGVNLGGVVNGIQAFLPQMIAHGRGGHIVNTASLAAVVPMPGQFAIYAATKAAVLSLSENMREDLGAAGIGMSVLCPGWVKSNIHQLGRNRPERFREGSGFGEAEAVLAKREIGENWLEPEAVGEMVADAIVANRLYIITHGEFRDRMEERHRALMAAVPDADSQF